MVCEQCGKEKPDVRERTDPYEADVNGVEIWIIVCDDCDALLAEEI